MAFWDNFVMRIPKPFLKTLLRFCMASVVCTSQEKIVLTRQCNFQPECQNSRKCFKRSDYAEKKLSAYEMLLWTQGHSKNRYEAFSRYRIKIQPCCLSRLWLIFNGCQLFELEKLNYGKVERASKRSVFNLNRFGLRWKWRLENK